MKIHLITLFEESIAPYLKNSIVSRASESDLVKYIFHNPRDYADNKWGKIDDKSYGGGPGMVLSALPVIASVEKALEQSPEARIIFLATDGETFTNTIAKKYADEKRDLIIICGHYEGIDERVAEVFDVEKISLGDFILTGGELPALCIIDATVRQMEGVLGNPDSVEEERVAGKAVYTRPECIERNGEKYCVPEVLLSGHHKNIEDFRQESQKVD